MANWISETERCDGLHVQKLADEHWIIRPGNGALPVEQCPCCDRSFPSRALARRVADWLYVPEDPPQAA